MQFQVILACQKSFKFRIAKAVPVSELVRHRVCLYMVCCDCVAATFNMSPGEKRGLIASGQVVSITVHPVGETKQSTSCIDGAEWYSRSKVVLNKTWCILTLQQNRNSAHNRVMPSRGVFTIHIHCSGQWVIRSIQCACQNIFPITGIRGIVCRTKTLLDSAVA